MAGLVEQQHRDAVPDRKGPVALSAEQLRTRRVEFKGSVMLRGTGQNCQQLRVDGG